MEVTLQWNQQHLRFDLNQPFDISLPYGNEGGVRCYGAPPFSAEPVVSGDFIGSLDAGSPVNFLNVKINPHGNGTHTECLGHIHPGGLTINQALREFHFLAKLISVTPNELSNGDLVIEREHLPDEEYPDAVVIRTLPNTQKQDRDYTGSNPAYLDKSVMDFLVGKGVKHVLVDLPSVDREDDGGKLEAHKSFWGIPDTLRKDCTLTELIFVADEIEDGIYLLNLQIVSFEIDVSPSKPVLYKPL